MRLLYSLLLYALTPLVLARLLWRSRRAPDYRRRWAERFGFGPRPATPPIWLHAVSVGEFQAALPLLKALRRCHPDIPLLVTTTTPTGSRRVRESFGDQVLHGYLPYDLPGAVRRFLGRARPRLVIVMETELWPNLFHQVRGRDIPLLLINARLSARSARGYARLGALTRRTLEQVDWIAAQGASDAERLRALGAPAERVSVVGNIKFEQEIPQALRARGEALRAQLGADRPVWVAASTHAGEDEQLLAAHRRVRARHPACALILVPRHPERFDAVAALCERQGWRLALRSAGAPDESTEVLLGDSMGEMPLYFAAADLAFMGGSLVSVGGHNPLEPAALGLPVLSGPAVFNFQEIMDAMSEAGALELVADEAALAERAASLLGDRDVARAMGQRGRALLARHRGVLTQLLQAVEERLR
ncbi:lipid IV(A) 3-deoxy-D-manno-octulosonic acid transferase [Alkalilimnicola sp. S0819]|uniref:lipid IV(A) 3-deoxy-D-manno-octulosonic acid transferase n=1 Tax=Alkalilimnicola sp. S0819 TaxID=2613922 RepID=UPI0012618551|nr:lipid IV(A) 3-deoxy-D-manno-octulosonic acid transferase [Alkalilimnicola sp. S0819]KAB7627339.1 3-deoxy-D-manno-octulosonic acid transferase [Alkalilimnicola sp. S0819]MPQ16055.1 3-deoxy-D-manno-octulosonic acid transferase [Alkalilimnicola sp. S0819]